VHQGRAAPLSRRGGEMTSSPACPAARAAAVVASDCEPASFLAVSFGLPCNSLAAPARTWSRLFLCAAVCVWSCTYACKTNRTSSINYRSRVGHRSNNETTPCMPLSCCVAYSPFYPHVTCSSHHCPAKTCMQCSDEVGSPFLPTEIGTSQPGNGGMDTE